MENQKLKQKSQLLTLKIGSASYEEDITTEIGGSLSPSYLLSLEEEDVRLQYKHLNLSYYDGSEVSDNT
jgi:hypothetical protein